MNNIEYDTCFFLSYDERHIKFQLLPDTPFFLFNKQNNNYFFVTPKAYRDDGTICGFDMLKMSKDMTTHFFHNDLDATRYEVILSPKDVPDMNMESFVDILRDCYYFDNVRICFFNFCNSFK